MQTTIKTAADLQALSYYTLCQLQRVTHYADPINGLPFAIAKGEYRGELITDELGNFRSFS